MVKPRLRKLRLAISGLLILPLALCTASSVIADGWTTELDLTATTTYALTMAVAPANSGTATDETGQSPYAAGAVVNIKAVPAAGHKFVNWSAPDGTFGNLNNATTTFTMPAQNITVTANFVAVYQLTMAVAPPNSGTANDETDQSPYAAGTQVSIKAEASEGYRFVNWTAPAGTFGNLNDALTTFTMPGEAVTVTANFVEAYDLTLEVHPLGSGTVTDLTDDPPYPEDAVVEIKAKANPSYRFVEWTAQPAVEFGNVTAPSTTFTMPGEAVTVAAHFQQMPSAITHAATDVLSYSAIVNMSYTVGDFSPVAVRFAWRRSVDTAWFYTDWVSRTADGDYAEVLTGLAARTEYEFKAQLEYDDTVMEGATRPFATGAQPLLGLGCFIATAVYGSPTAEQLDVLREFRDVVLLGSTTGTRFVTLYYRLSPPVADFIAGNAFLRTLVRELLVDPVVWIVQATGNLWRN
jgi:hypothetical protein